MEKSKVYYTNMKATFQENLPQKLKPVSYTHLDVYKRQERDSDIHAVYVDRITSVTPINMNMSIGLKEAMVEKYM